MNETVKKSNGEKMEERYFLQNLPFDRVNRIDINIITTNLKAVVSEEKYQKLKKEYGKVIELDDFQIEAVITGQTFERRNVVMVRCWTDETGSYYVVLGIADDNLDNSASAIYKMLPHILKNDVDWDGVLEKIALEDSVYYLEDEYEYPYWV